MLFLRVVFFYFGVRQTKRKSSLKGEIYVLDEKCGWTSAVHRLFLFSSLRQHNFLNQNE